MSYEADLWGGQAANTRGARSRLIATQENTDALALVVQSEVATNYFSAVALRERIVIVEQNLKLVDELLRKADEGRTATETGFNLDLHGLMYSLFQKMRLKPDFQLMQKFILLFLV